MSNLSKSQIESFQILFQKEFGINIDKQEAAELGTQLVTLIKTIVGNISP